MSKLAKPDFGLTPRQIEVTKLLMKGYRYADIAETLGITIGTTKQHLHMIYSKLGVKNWIEATEVMQKAKEEKKAKK
jgi:DNA-binding CsgD family transcriptional regulator